MDPSTAIQLTNTTGTPLTQYYIYQTQNLPLLDPIRAIPVIGQPIVDLIQPDLKVLVDLGYGSTTQGWSPGAPNVPTAFGVLPPVSPGAVLSALGAGTQQGIGAFTSDISAMASSPASFSLAGMTSSLGALGSNVTTGSAWLPAIASAVSSPASFISSVQGANAFLAGAFSGALSAAYGTLLPTADIVNALAISMPSYDINLFLDGVEQIVNGDPVNGLIYAFGAPVAADTALLTLAGGFELRVLEHSAVSIIDDFTPPAP
jgi:hypothetical protein